MSGGGEIVAWSAADCVGAREKSIRSVGEEVKVQLWFVCVLCF